MARYFMSDTRLAGLERMMMDSSRPAPPRSIPRQKRPQKKLPCNRPVKQRPPKQEIKEGGI